MSDFQIKTYQQILSTMIAKLKLKTDLTDLADGSLQLTILEAAAAQDFSTLGKLIQLLNLRNIDKAKGVDLEAIAFENGVSPLRNGSEPAIGQVQIKETSFTKVSSNIYAGANSPTAGDTAIKIVSGSGFIPSGTIFIGRNTETYEPVDYSSLTDTGSYWIINLSSPLAKDHLVGEEVVMAQGGDRTVSAGSVVQVPAFSGIPAVTFTIQNKAILLDGEDTLGGITISANAPGSLGNVGRNKISEFAGNPWSTAAVSNPDPATQGRDPEIDEELKQRIKDRVHSLGRGTEKSITRAVKSVSDPDQNNRVESAYLREPISSDQPALLFIDDGTGFQPTFSGVGEEVIVQNASGGEGLFQLQKWPLVKTQVGSVGTEPFNISGGEFLNIEIDGAFTEASLNGSFIRNAGVASAQELSEAINSAFSSFVEARAKGGQLFVTPLSNNPDYIRVATATQGTDANTAIRFPIRKQYTVRLYKNDKLLEKGGQEALIQSFKVATISMSSGETVQLNIDGIDSPVVTFTDSDFTLYSSSQVLASGSASDWAKVINRKFIGVTATSRDDGTFTVKSNRGSSTTASISVISGSLSGKLFSAGSVSVGKSSDYKINRLLGQLELTNQLSAGDQLKAGTVNTRGFILTGSQALYDLSYNPNPAEVVVLADSLYTDVVIIQSGTFSFSIPAPGTLSVTAAIGKFSGVKVDDYAHLYGCPRNSVLRVKAISVDGSSVKFHDPAPIGGSVVIDGINSFVKFFRTNGLPQLIQFDNNAVTSSASVLLQIQTKLSGIFAQILDSGQIRIETLRFSGDYGIAIPSFGGNSLKLGFSTGNYASNDPHVAAVESSDLSGTPSNRLTVNVDDNTLPFDDLNTNESYFDHDGSNKQIEQYYGSSEHLTRRVSTRISTNEVTLRDDSPSAISGLGKDTRATQLSGLEFGQNDNMVFLVDSDPQRKTFDVPMYLDGKVSGPSVPTNTQIDIVDPTGAAYGSSARWAGFDLNDYRVWFKAKRDLPFIDADAKLRFTAVPFGPMGEKINVGVYYPSAPAQDAQASMSVDAANDQVQVFVTLASGAEKSLNLQPGRKVKVSTLAGVNTLNFLYPVSLAAIQAGDISVLNDQAFSTANQGAMRVEQVTNLFDFSRSFQFKSESLQGDTAGNMISLSSTPSQAVELGDQVSVTGTKKTIVAVTGVSQGGSAVNKIDVGAGGAFAASGSIRVNNSVTVTYTSYSEAASIGSFTGLNMDPVLAGISPGQDAVQTISSPLTFTVTVVTDARDFSVSSNVTAGTSMLITIIHKALTASSAPSFAVQPGDCIEISSQVLQVVSVVSPTVYEMDQSFTFTGLQGGIINRIQLKGHKVSGINEIVAASSAQSVRVFALDQAKNKASTLITLVNGTAGVQDVVSASNGPNSAGTASVLYSSSNSGSQPSYALQNGESYVFSTSNSSPAIRMKEPATIAPEIGDAVRLVPSHSINVFNHFSKKQVTGLSIASDIALVDRGRRVQVSSKTPGGLGQVFAIGGRASGSNVLNVRGTAREVNPSRAILELDRSSIDLLIPGHTIKFTQSGRAKKRWVNGDPTSITNLQINALSIGARITLDTNFAIVYSYTQSGTVQWTVRNIGRNRTRFEIVSGTAVIPSSLKADDFVLIGDGSTYAGVTSASSFVRANQGWAQVLETDNTTYFDVEGQKTEETVSTTASSFVFTPYHSVRPGDQIVIGNDVPVSTGNKGTFIITNVPTPFSVDYLNPAYSLQTSVALGSAGALAISSLDQGFSTYRKVTLLAPKPDDPAGRSLVAVSPGYNMSLISEGQNAKISLPNRLGFAADPVPGISGYSFWTGLLRRVQRVVDGYEPDPSTFEGYSASGVTIEVRGPQVSRLKLSLQAKTAKGVSLQSIADTIKSTIASYVNSLDLGKDVILSEIIRQVQEVPGVESCVITLPLPSSSQATSGRITVSSNSVARISTSDITIS